MPTFTRQERLKSRKTIGRFFSKEGHSYVAYPLRVVWLEADELRAPTPPPTPPSPGGETLLSSVSGTPLPVGEGSGVGSAQVVITVPKRLFKTAVQRNRLKRQIREAYRLNKQDLYDKLAASKLHISLMLSYIAKEALPYADIEAGVKKMVRKFPGEG